MKMFPLRIRIQLVPQLNVLTIDLENEVFSTDDILSDLQINDKGNNINVKDMKTIISDTNERLYEWLHNWAGLYLDIQKPLSIKEGH